MSDMWSREAPWVVSQSLPGSRHWPGVKHLILTAERGEGDLRGEQNKSPRT